MILEKLTFIYFISLLICTSVAQRRPNEDPPQEIDVAVIGLGLAGAEIMSLASVSGRTPVAFESRHTYGGRTQSIDIGGYSLPKGGGWQQGTGQLHPLSKRISECGISTKKQNWNSWLDFGKSGEEISAAWGEFESAFACAELLSEEMKTSGADDVSQYTGLKMCGWVAQLVSEFLAQISTLDFEWAEGAFVNSLKNTLLWLTYYVYNDEDRFVTDPRGSEEMVGCWLDRYGFGREQSYHINYNSPVVNIDTASQILTIENGTRYHYQVLFNTMPLGVLSWNQVSEDGSLFTPPLSTSKTLALHTYHTPLYQKIFFQFPTNFWNSFSPNKEFFNIYANSLHSCFLWQNVDLNDGWLPGSRILYVTCTSPQSDQGENLDESEWTELLMPQLRKVFGSDIPDPELVVVSRWLNDPNFRGTYSNRPVEHTQERFDEFYEPFGIGNTHIFTGEGYCMNMNGYMHAAILAAETSWCEYQVRNGDLPVDTPCRAEATDADGDVLPNYCFNEGLASKKREMNNSTFVRYARTKSSRLSDEEFIAMTEYKINNAMRLVN